MGTPIPSTKPLAFKASTQDSVPNQLTINGRTFSGPLPPNRVSDPSRNAANLPGDHSNYKLFVCAECPIPPKAREAFANRRRWLDLGKPLEETRLSNGRLPRLRDEDGEPVTRGLMSVQKGADLNKAYDEIVKQRYRAIIGGDECCAVRDVAKDDHRFKECSAAHREAREAMLENMSWSFDW
jgi:hypothetical protein